jgi:EpsI family protein
MTSRLIVLTMSVLAAVFCLRATMSQERVPPRRPLAEMPFALGEWTAARQQDFDPATVAVLRVDDYVSRNYSRRSSDTADVYVGYYETQRQGDTIHSPMNCLPAAGWQLLSVARAPVDAVSGQTIVVNRNTIQKGLDKRLVLYWYQSHGRAVASEYWSKAYLVLDSLRLHRTDGALVRVITPIRDSDTRAERSAVDFIRALYPVLRRHLPG